MDFTNKTLLSNAKRDRLLFASILTIGLILTLLDVLNDINEGLEWRHIEHEIILSLVFVVGFAVLYWRKKWHDKNYQAHITRATYDLLHFKRQSEEHHKKWEKLALGMGKVIDEQFLIWKLTNAERDIAFFILKGLSTVEIAAIRKSSERTVRQQCQSVYKKSNLSGRASLSAYFLEDILQDNVST